jgi:hypothetical protein
LALAFWGSEAPDAKGGNSAIRLTCVNAAFRLIASY